MTLRRTSPPGDDASLSERARQMARDDPTLSAIAIARAIGMSRTGVLMALRRGRPVSLRDARRRKGDGRALALDKAQQKLLSGGVLTRDERHRLHEEYRRREREGVAS